jgi:hypothetical protein
MLLLVVKAGARERKALRERVKETREGLRDAGEKINALIDAQMRHEEAYAQFKQRTDEEMAQLARRTDEEMAHLARAQANTEEKLSAFIANTDEKLGVLITTVDRIANERGNGKA